MEIIINEFSQLSKIGRENVLNFWNINNLKYQETKNLETAFNSFTAYYNIKIVSIMGIFNIKDSNGGDLYFSGRKVILFDISDIASEHSKYNIVLQLITAGLMFSKEKGFVPIFRHPDSKIMDIFIRELKIPDDLSAAYERLLGDNTEKK